MNWLWKILNRKNNKDYTRSKTPITAAVHMFPEVWKDKDISVAKPIQVYKSNILNVQHMFNLIAPEIIVDDPMMLTNLMGNCKYCIINIEQILSKTVDEIGVLNRFIIDTFSILHRVVIKIPVDKQLITAHSFTYCTIDNVVWSKHIRFINMSLFPMYTPPEILSVMSMDIDTDVNIEEGFTPSDRIKLENKLHYRFVNGMDCGEVEVNAFTIMYSQMTDYLLAGQLEYEVDNVNKNNPYEVTKEIFKAVINTIEEMFKHEKIISSECAEKRVQ